MSDNNFLNKYSTKIKALNPNDSTAGADWTLMEMRLEAQDKKRRRRYLFLFVFILLLVGLVGKYVYDQNKNLIKQGDHIPVASSIQNNNDLRHAQVNKEASDSENDINDDVKVLGSTSKRFEKDEPGNKNVVNKTVEPDVKKLKNKGKYILSFNAHNGIGVTGKEIEQKMSDSYFADEIMTALQPSNENVNINEKKTDTSIITNDRTYSKSSPTLEILTLREADRFTAVQSNKSVQITFPEIRTKSPSKIKYFLKIDGGPIMTTHSGSPEMMPGMLNFSTHTMSKDVGIQTGLSLQLVSNAKWKFGVGVTRSVLNYHTSHKASLRLMDGICLNPNSPDPKEYVFTYNVTNGRSSSMVNLRLSEENPGTPLDSTEVFNIEMGMHKKTVSWAIPITAERVIYTKGDWSIFSKAGIALGFASKIKEDISHFSESCAGLCFNHGFSPSILNQKSNQITTGILLGMSVEWKLNSKFRIVMNPEINFMMSLPSENHNNHTKWGVNIGAMYQIK